MSGKRDAWMSRRGQAGADAAIIKSLTASRSPAN